MAWVQSLVRELRSHKPFSQKRRTFLLLGISPPGIISLVQIIFKFPLRHWLQSKELETNPMSITRRLANYSVSVCWNTMKLLKKNKEASFVLTLTISQNIKWKKGRCRTVITVWFYWNACIISICLFMCAKSNSGREKKTLVENWCLQREQLYGWAGGGAGVRKQQRCSATADSELHKHITTRNKGCVERHQQSANGTELRKTPGRKASE